MTISGTATNKPGIGYVATTHRLNPNIYSLQAYDIAT